MARIVEINGTGVSAMSLAEILAEVHARYRAKFGEDLSLSPQTPQAQIAGITAGIAAEITEAIVEDVNANSVDHAGGVLLSQLGSLLGIEFVGATHSRVTATLTGVSGTGVPAGSRARTTAGAQFETLAPALLSPSGVDVDMQSIDEGPITAQAGTLNEIVTVVPGWETITNDLDAAPGILGQTDQAYRLSYQARTGRLASGTESAIRAAIDEAGGLKQAFVENPSAATITEQQWPLFPHSIVAVAQSGAAGDIRRAVDLRRGQGVTEMVAIIGGPPAAANAFTSMTAGRIVWAGVEFTGLDLSSTTTPAQRATALSTLLADADPAVTVRAIDGRFFAFYGWRPADPQPAFANGSTGTDAATFGLDAASATAAPGPFARARERDLTITATIARRAAFPGDGIARIRTAINGVVDGYGIGEEAWINDFLVAIESVPGTRVASDGLTVQHEGNDVSGVAVPLDILWTLPPEQLTITVA